MKIYQKNGLVIVEDKGRIVDVLPAADIRMTPATTGILITSVQHNFYRNVEKVSDEEGNEYPTVELAIQYLTENLGLSKTEETREFSDEFSDEFA
ncbi:hypothetical protein V9L05_01520 [Bernardetia sp. Wsw4-3y2]|uniref:hypothetical protein n=2 Tax=unclassified Bernardetia TaxID=2647129 RepID=UPI0030CC8E05